MWLKERNGRSIPDGKSYRVRRRRNNDKVKKDRAISPASRRDVYKVCSIFLPFLIVILISRSSYDNSYSRYIT